MDARAQVGQMSQESRQAFAQRIRSRLLPGDLPTADHDVSVIGGGVAALTLALEIRSARVRTTRILIIEPNVHPVPEITHTVGESTVEVSAHYLRDRLGLADHLSTAQIRKMGLRMFFSHDGKHRHRPADGTRQFLVRTAGDLPDRPRQAGERAQPTVRGRTVSTSPAAGSVPWNSVPTSGPHTISFQTGDAVAHTTARWVVDASGRNRTLPRQLDLRQANEHHCNAAWFRVATEIDVGRWSDDPTWQAPPDRGRPCDVHQPPDGRGLLGLAHPARLRCHQRRHRGRPGVSQRSTTFNTLDRAKAWLREHEPQCAAVVAEHAHLIKDFRVMKKYSHGAAKVFDGRGPMGPHR